MSGVSKTPDVEETDVWMRSKGSKLVDKPKLRQLDFQPVVYQDQHMWLARDPLELSGEQLLLSPALAQLAV